MCNLAPLYGPTLLTTMVIGTTNRQNIWGTSDSFQHDGRLRCWPPYRDGAKQKVLHSL